MRKSFIACVILFLSFMPLFSSPLNFKEFADKQKLSFVMPKDFRTVPVVFNHDVRYDFAIRHVKKKLEIRYAIFSLTKQIDAYKKSLKDPKTVMTDPNKRYTSFTWAACMNISGGKPFKAVRAFKPADVRKEFNANWGATILIESKSEFARGYRYVLVVTLHRDSVADAFIFYLFDDIKKINKEMTKAFYALKYQK